MEYKQMLENSSSFWLGQLGKHAHGHMLELQGLRQDF